MRTRGRRDDRPDPGRSPSPPELESPQSEDRVASWQRLLRFATPATVLLCAALLLWVQFSFDGMYDGDSYFHTRAARELSEHGIRREFPQASVSTWSTTYSDKDFLYHVLLIPFQVQHRLFHGSGTDDEDLVTPGKEAAAFFDLLLLAGVALSLGGVGARFGPLWLLLLFSMDVHVTAHLLAVRPHVLGATLLVVEAALLVRRSVWGVGALAMLHVYSHSSFVLVPGLAACLVAAYLLRGEPAPWRSFAAAVGGVAAGNVLNPFFPNNLSLAWDQTVEVARNLWGGGGAIPAEVFGAELSPETTKDFLECFAGWAPAVLGLLAFLALKRTRALSTSALALLAMNVVLGLLAFMSVQFIVFWAPLAILLAGRVWTELAADRPLRQIWVENRRELLLGAGALALCLAAGQYADSVVRLREKAQGTYTRSGERAAVDYLREHAAPDDLVYHNFWWDFSVLYHYRPEGRYVVGLDPVFMYRRDPEKFRAMLQAYDGKASNVYEIVAKQFGARWVYVSRSNFSPSFVALLRDDPRFVRVYQDRNAGVYQVRANP